MMKAALLVFLNVVLFALAAVATQANADEPTLLARSSAAAVSCGN
jgi:hypothetical protein